MVKTSILPKMTSVL